MYLCIIMCLKIKNNYKITEFCFFNNLVTLLRISRSPLKSQNHVLRYSGIRAQ